MNPSATHRAPARHEMILAAAGSGKTHQLTNRYLGLLAGGEPAGRIIALTFTRKAAGEFLDRILERLAEAARDPAAAARTAREIGHPALGPGDFQRLLRGLAGDLHRLALGTLDSFFHRIARAYALELGLSGRFQILDDFAARLAREDALLALFEELQDDPAAFQAFHESFKQATFGSEEKRLAELLRDHLEERYPLFLAAPAAAAWGDPARIFDPAFADPPGPFPEESWAAFAACCRAQSLKDAPRQRLEELAVRLPAWQPGAALETALKGLLTNARTIWPELREGRGVFTLMRQKIALDPAGAAGLREVVRWMVAGELHRRAARTRGLHRVLEGYDRLYERRVRRPGRLTFSDLQRLLDPRAAPVGPLLLGQAGGAAADPALLRLLIDYRLDGRYDHWLLDEFQDTSFGQWSILENLVDEVLQDPDRRRSLFYVGDLKQSIFGWRAGDHRLFGEIRDRYNRHAPVIAERRLAESHRSVPDLVAMINRACGEPAWPRWRELGLPEGVLGEWRNAWDEHRSARTGPGQAALLHAEDEEGRFALTARLLACLRPLARGLTCAVLVRRNRTAQRLANYLRALLPDPVLVNADLHPGADNPAASALLSLVQWLAHPDDRFARGHLELLAPLRGLFPSPGDPAGLEQFLAGQSALAAEEGWAGWAAHWRDRWLPTLDPADEFSRLRLGQVIEAARAFDATGGFHPDEFRQFLENHPLREEGSHAVIQILTVHKAKGLGFDLVVCPEFGEKTVCERPQGLLVRRDANRAVEWVCELPPADFHEFDDHLRAQAGSAAEDHAFEELCVLYVALTRAKFGLYAITHPPDPKASSPSPSHLLNAALADPTVQSVTIAGEEFPGSFAGGDPTWVDSREAAVAADPVVTPAPWPEAPARARPAALRPSGQAGGTFRAEVFLDPAPPATERGRLLHALAEGIEWWDPATDRPPVPDPAASPERAAVGAELARALAEPAIAALLCRPEGTAELWREQPFEALLDNRWVSGVFDRVTLEREPSGAYGRAAILDWKTDRMATPEEIDGAVAHHRPQIALYREVVARLTGLPLERVDAWLVFTWPAVARACPLRDPA